MCIPPCTPGYQATGGVPKMQVQGRHQAVRAECRSPPWRAGSEPDPPGCRRLPSGPGRGGVGGFLGLAQCVGSRSHRASSPWMDTAETPGAIPTTRAGQRLHKTALSGQGVNQHIGFIGNPPPFGGESRLWQSFKTQFLHWQLSGVRGGGWLQRLHEGGFGGNGIILPPGCSEDTGTPICEE